MDLTEEELHEVIKLMKEVKDIFTSMMDDFKKLFQSSQTLVLEEKLSQKVNLNYREKKCLVKINEKDKEMIKADFIKSYKRIKIKNVNNNSNTKRALDQPQFETDDEENAEEDHTDNNLSDEESGNEFVQRGEVLPTANHN